MGVFNVVEYTFPDGSHRWKYFTEAQSFDFEQPPHGPVTPMRDPGWTVSRKERENAIRAKNTIYDLARANSDKWDWFVTLTFNPIFCDRQSYRECYDYVREFSRSLTSLGCYWLFVPEHHKDGLAYHFHGLVGGEFPMDYAGLHGRKGAEVDTWNVRYWPGYSVVQRIRDRSRVCTYITKYITKDLVSLVPKGCHRYLRSRNLVKPTMERMCMTKGEFATYVNLGEYFTDDTFTDGLSQMRYVKEIPVAYRAGTESVYIVED